ncbi:MAG: hypothetical protein ACYSWU_04185 [Planctomycetota bacterium]|jgi:hypothetical protein
MARPVSGGVVMTVTGDHTLIRALNTLPIKAQRRVARSAVKKVARVMVKRVKATIKEGSHSAFDSGLLAKSIGFRSWTSKKGQWAVGATIGARHGFGTLVARNKQGKKKGLTKKGIAKVVAAGGSFSRRQFADPAKYAHLPEGGTKQRAGGRGAVRGVHFMEHTHLRSRGEMGNKLRTEIANGIEFEARKLAKR